MAEAIDTRPLVTRKPHPKAPPALRCTACNRVIEPTPWPYDRHQGAPICDGCTRNWMSVSRLGMTGATRGDFRRLMRMSAFINLITWEVVNGR